MHGSWGYYSITLVCHVVLFNMGDTRQDCQEVICNDLSSSCNVNRTQVYLEDNRKLTCSVEAAYKDSDIPRPGRKNVTAVPPDSLQADCRKIFNSRIKKYKQALDITWDYEERWISSGSTVGFFLTIDNKFSYYVSINIEEKHADDTIETPTHIKFRYNCHGEENRLLQTGDEISLQIGSVPLSKWDDWTNRLRHSYVVPEASQCKDERESKTSLCAWDTSTNATSEFHSDKKTGASSKTWRVLAASIFIVVVLSVTIITCYFIKKQVKKKSEEAQKDTDEPMQPLNHNRTALLLTNPMQASDCSKAHKLATKLRDEIRTHLKVICNWENRCKILAETVQWYEQKIEQADAVIFINATEKIINDNVKGKKDSENSEFARVIAYYFNKFESTMKDSIFLLENEEEMTSLKQCDALKHCQIFLFKEELSENNDFYMFLTRHKNTSLQGRSQSQNMTPGRLKRKERVASFYELDETNPLVQDQEKKARSLKTNEEIVELHEMHNMISGNQNGTEDANNNGNGTTVSASISEEDYKKKGARPKSRNSKQSRTTGL